MTTAGVGEMKAAHKAMWGKGDYPSLATLLLDLADDLVAGAEIGPGDRVLDVATGSGNAAIAAARTGATVTGLDLSPALVEAAREAAAAAGVEVEFVEGDAEELPFADGSFDKVISAIGAQFAPRHAETAAELARVCRPGGVVGMCNWTPEGTAGEMFAVQSARMPAPPPFASPPILWGTEAHVEEMFAGHGVDFEFQRGDVFFSHDSVEAFTDYFCASFGPLIVARSVLEPQGKWDEVISELKAVYERRNEAEDGTLRFRQEYLRAIGRKAG